MNGEDANPDGCLVTVGWSAVGPSVGVAVEMYSMLTGKRYLSWTSTTQRRVNAVASHLQYAAVALDGEALVHRCG